MPASRAKLLPPPVSPTTLPRPALEATLDEAFGARLTTVVAGSGFGKSTAVARWASDVRCVWYTLGPAEATLGALARCLIELVEAGTRARLSGQRQWTEEPGNLHQPEVLATFLARELESRLDHDLVLVLDDVHELGESESCMLLLEALCRQLPAVVHLVLLSRFELPFATARLRGRGELVEIGAAALAFSQDEVRELSEQILGSGEATVADVVHERTGGWPAAVRLVLERLRSARPEERGQLLDVVPEELFAYLADEVLEQEPETTRELIRVLSPFERVTPELMEALGTGGARDALESLARRGLFVVRHDLEDGWYSLHALMRDLVARRFQLDEGAREDLLRRAAGWHEKRGDAVQALRAYVEAGDGAGIARVLAASGANLLLAGEASLVLGAGEALSHPTRPTVERTLGDAHALRGEWSEALDCYERAAGDGTLPAALAWRIGRIHFDRGRLDEALDAYSRGSTAEDEPERARLLAWTASCRWTRGERSEARRLADEALAAAGDDPHALAVAHNVLLLVSLGTDPDGGEGHYRAGLAAAEAAGDGQLVVRLRANRATQLNAQGAYASALEVIAPAIDAAELAGGGLQVAFPLLKRGEVLLNLSRLEDAVADFKAALAVYERYGSLRRYGALANLGDAYLARGDVALARAVLEDVVRAAESSSDAQLLLFGSLSLARAVAFDDPARGTRLAQQATAASERLGTGLELATLASGWVALASGKRAAARRLATEAARHAERVADEPHRAEALILRALAAEDALAELDSLELAAAIARDGGHDVLAATADLLRTRLGQPPDGRRAAAGAELVLRRAGIRLVGSARVAGPLAFVPAERPPAAEVRTLGGFAVLRDGHPVPLSSWKSRQARDLLKMLVARRGRPLPREQLMAVLWPEKEPRAVSGRFSYVLSTLRSVLEAEKDPECESFIEAEGDAVRLRTDLVEVDVEAFLRDAERGLAAPRGEPEIALLEQAEASYGGDFLEEDAYADWAVPLREEARAVYISVARALAADGRTRGDHAAATRYLLRILERDAYDEQAHLALAATLEESGAHGEARRAYRRYVAAMDGIGVEPAPYPGQRPSGDIAA